MADLSWLTNIGAGAGGLAIFALMLRAFLTEERGSARLVTSLHKEMARREQEHTSQMVEVRTELDGLRDDFEDLTKRYSSAERRAMIAEVQVAQAAMLLTAAGIAVPWAITPPEQDRRDRDQLPPGR